MSTDYNPLTAIRIDHRTNTNGGHAYDFLTCEHPRCKAWRANRETSGELFEYGHTIEAARAAANPDYPTGQGGEELQDWRGMSGQASERVRAFWKMQDGEGQVLSGEISADNGDADILDLYTGARGLGRLFWDRWGIDELEGRGVPTAAEVGIDLSDTRNALERGEVSARDLLDFASLPPPISEGVYTTILASWIDGIGIDEVLKWLEIDTRKRAEATATQTPEGKHRAWALERLRARLWRVRAAYQKDLRAATYKKKIKSEAGKRYRQQVRAREAAERKKKKERQSKFLLAFPARGIDPSRANIKGVRRDAMWALLDAERLYWGADGKTLHLTHKGKISQSRLRAWARRKK